MKVVMKRIFSLPMILLLTLIMAVGGCATARGMAEDFQNLGRGIKKTISEYEASPRPKSG